MEDKEMMWCYRGEKRVMDEYPQSLSHTCEIVTMKPIILYNYYIIISCNYIIINYIRYMLIIYIIIIP